MTAQEKQALPDWAPDNCPPNVVKLIDDDQYLEDLGLRGLSSADSAELHQAVRNLQRQLGEAFQKGTASRGWRWRTRPWQCLALGWLVGVLCGAWVLHLVLG
ncbi:MAG: hypothetical protein IIA11_02705 [Proteobacteria bacterium]|nr:hypothetical protein [Pseudomonadota bacterium]